MRSVIFAVALGMMFAGCAGGGAAKGPGAECKKYIESVETACKDEAMKAACEGVQKGLDAFKNSPSTPEQEKACKDGADAFAKAQEAMKAAASAAASAPASAAASAPASAAASAPAVPAAPAAK